jgi:hypothetical protein
MASVFKLAGKSKYVIIYTDENGKRRKKIGATDKAVSQRLANELENKVAMRRGGLVDPAAELYRDHEALPLTEHISAWQADLVARGFAAKHAEHTTNRARRLVTVVLGSSPSALDPRRLAPCDRRDMTTKERAVNNFPFCLQYVIKPVVKSAASRRNAWTRMHRKSSG